MEKDEFLRQIVTPGRSSSASVHLISPDQLNISTPLVDLLDLNKERLCKESLLILDILENDEDFGCRKEYQEFKWMVLAYITVQDAFPTILYDGVDKEVIFARNYFYYEALSILREFIYCGLNNFTVSARHLVRTFIEFNLRQLYFFEKCKRDRSYVSMRDYFSNGVAPSNQSIINFIVPSTSFCKPIKKSIQVVLKGLSNSSSHAFDPVQSTRSFTKLRHEYSLDAVLFWLTMYGSFSTVLWPYYLVFPTLLRPRDVVRKFGYNYIPGLFIANEQHIAIKKTFKDNEMALFMEADPIKFELDSLDEIYNSFPDLSDDEIDQTWTEAGRPQNHLVGYGQMIAQMRITNEVLANKFAVDNTEEILTNNIKTDLGIATKYSFWKDNYKSM